MFKELPIPAETCSGVSLSLFVVFTSAPLPMRYFIKFSVSKYRQIERIKIFHNKSYNFSLGGRKI